MVSKKSINFILLILLFLTTTVTIVPLLEGGYLDDLKNLKSLNEKEKYMLIDTLIIQKLDYKSSGTVRTYVVEAQLISDCSSVKIYFNKEKFVTEMEGYSKRKIPIYKSVLNNNFFLKGSQKGYYEKVYRSIYSGLFFKFLFFVMLLVYVFKIKKKYA